jgi:hypothetical protein
VDSSPDIPPPVGDPRWFREPSAREHGIAAGLFVGFGVFFVLLFIVQRGWWFGWIVLGMGIVSLLLGARHALDALRWKGRLR